MGWAYRGPLEFRRRASEYLADGLAHGLRVELVAPGRVEQLEDLLCSLPGGRSALDTGAAVALGLDGYYPLGSTGAVDPAAAVAEGVSRSRHWVQQGFAGLRAIVDATELNRTPEDRAAFSAFEVLGDAAIACGAGSALCAFDADVLGPAAGELTCLHPFTDARSTPFRIFADGDGGLVLAGDVDSEGQTLFETSVGRVLASHESTELRVDLAEADFLGHRALLALEQGARASGHTVVLRNPKAVVARIVELIDAPALKVEDR